MRLLTDSPKEKQVEEAPAMPNPIVSQNGVANLSGADTPLCLAINCVPVVNMIGPLAPVLGFSQAVVITENHTLPREDLDYTFQIPPFKDDAKEDKPWEKDLLGVQDELLALKGPVPWGSIDAMELCITPKTLIPQKFKVLDFDKYDGIGNPVYHLWSYYTKMLIWSIDEQFLEKFFLEILKGFVLSWFMKLDSAKIRRWKDLSKAFVKQYKVNLYTTKLESK